MSTGGAKVVVVVAAVCFVLLAINMEPAGSYKTVTPAIGPA
jgi:hypothetical protein